MHTTLHTHTHRTLTPSHSRQMIETLVASSGKPMAKVDMF